MSQEIAVPVEVQQKASLYGIGAVLVGLSGIPNKKAIKKAVKRLSKDIKSVMPLDGAKELMGQNKAAVEAVFIGIRKDPKHTSDQRKKLIKVVTEDLLASYKIGIKKLGGE